MVPTLSSTPAITCSLALSSIWEAMVLMRLAIWALPPEATRTSGAWPDSAGRTMAPTASRVSMFSTACSRESTVRRSSASVLPEAAWALPICSVTWSICSWVPTTSMGR
jgi:hypothetical protein